MGFSLYVSVVRAGAASWGVCPTTHVSVCCSFMYLGPILETSCEGLVWNILCPKQKIINQTNNKAKMCKDTNYCYFLPQTREAMIETNPEIWDFNLKSIDDYYLRFGKMSFLALAVNQHGALSSPNIFF